ncbi:DUF1990 domain-containing protein [Streptomyces sp. ODS28]|uniref:DUF1990 family protein n=1 Tax=Streptomyces sp. ODS28 TaxID=3136688 RepID=UPI0031E8E92A
MTYQHLSEPAGFTYRDIGATREGRTPAGFGALAVRTRLGTGDAVFAAAERALMEWRMHRAMGVRIDASAERAAPGVRVTVGLGVGPLRVHGPCEVVWTVSGEDRAGWAYGTLPGHPECGEEAFLLTRERRRGARGPGTVWLTVSAFSRPAVWWARAAGPLVPVFQRAYAHRCGTVLRRLATEAAA